MSDISSAALMQLALDLTNSLTTDDRFERLLNTVRQTISCDAVVLLHVQGEYLTPLAQQGLTKETLGRRFEIASHPRFAQICASQVAVRFAADSGLADPYDGLLLAHEGDLPVHACIYRLFSNEKLMGILTLDSMQPRVFDTIPKRTLDIITAMSAATLSTAMLLQTLEQLSKHNQKVVAELTHEALIKDGGELIGNSEIIVKLKHEITMVAASHFSILIEGETGVGKELVARTLHRQSSRSDGPLVYVNCAALPESLIESELFGHVKGAFTGAERHRTGKFSLASGGTIFLDEIGELPLAVQSKLLRALQNKEIQVVGKDDVEYVDVRILAATNRQLSVEVEQGRFRADLYHRLSVYPIIVPPLRQREGDISLLSGYFIELTRRKLGMSQLTLEASAIKMLNQYDWPGNVRELGHVISRAALRARNDSAAAIVRIGSKHLALLLPHTQQPKQCSETTAALTSTQQIDVLAQGTLKQQTDEFQRQRILQYLTQYNGNWSAAAKALDMDRANLNRLAKRLGIRVSKRIEIESVATRPSGEKG